MSKTRSGPHSARLSECPACSQKLRRGAHADAKYSKRALMLFAVAGVVGGLWAVIVLLWSPVFLVPKGIGGMAVCAIFYLWPGVLISLFASSLPRVRTTRCGVCGWSETVVIRKR